MNRSTIRQTIILTRGSCSSECQLMHPFPRLERHLEVLISKAFFREVQQLTPCPT